MPLLAENGIQMARRLTGNGTGNSGRPDAGTQQLPIWRQRTTPTNTSAAQVWGGEYFQRPDRTASASDAPQLGHLKGYSVNGSLGAPGVAALIARIWTFGLRDVKHLDLSNCRLTNAQFTAICVALEAALVWGAAPLLRSMDLSGNPDLTNAGTTGGFFASIGVLSQLETVDLRDTGSDSDTFPDIHNSLWD